MGWGGSVSGDRLCEAAGMYKLNSGSEATLAERGNDFMLPEGRQNSSIRLIEPTMEYEKDIWQFRQEIISSNDMDKFAGCGNLEDCSSVKEWINTIDLHRSEETCPKGRVPSRIYIAVSEEDNRFALSY